VSGHVVSSYMFGCDSSCSSCSARGSNSPLGNCQTVKVTGQFYNIIIDVPDRTQYQVTPYSDSNCQNALFQRTVTSGDCVRTGESNSTYAWAIGISKNSQVAFGVKCDSGCSSCRGSGVVVQGTCTAESFLPVQSVNVKISLPSAPMPVALSETWTPFLRKSPWIGIKPRVEVDVARIARIAQSSPDGDSDDYNATPNDDSDDYNATPNDDSDDYNATPNDDSDDYNATPNDDSDDYDVPTDFHFPKSHSLAPWAIAISVVLPVLFVAAVAVLLVYVFVIRKKKFWKSDGQVKSDDSVTQVETL